jgi:hypothetical protein
MTLKDICMEAVANKYMGQRGKAILQSAITIFVKKARK